MRREVKLQEAGRIYISCQLSPHNFSNVLRLIFFSQTCSPGPAEAPYCDESLADFDKFQGCPRAVQSISQSIMKKALRTDSVDCGIGSKHCPLSFPRLQWLVSSGVAVSEIINLIRLRTTHTTTTTSWSRSTSNTTDFHYGWLVFCITSSQDMIGVVDCSVERPTNRGRNTIINCSSRPL